jgi:hypothetical protein
MHFVSQLNMEVRVLILGPASSIHTRASIDDPNEGMALWQVGQRGTRLSGEFDPPKAQSLR